MNLVKIDLDQFAFKFYPSKAMFSPDGQRLYIGGRYFNENAEYFSGIFRYEIADRSINEILTTPQSNSFSFNISYSEQYAIISTGQRLLDEDRNYYEDVYRIDLRSGEQLLVSSAVNGFQGNDHSNGASISGNGDLIAFISEATLTANDDDDSDVHIRQITSKKLLNTDQISEIDAYQAPQVSRDGTKIAFIGSPYTPILIDLKASRAVDLIDQLRRYTDFPFSDPSDFDRDVNAFETLTLASGGRYVLSKCELGIARIDTVGYEWQIVGDELSVTNVDSGPSLRVTQSISADGRYVAFVSESSGLVSLDVNGVADAFVKDMVTGKTYLVSRPSQTGQFALATESVSISEDGSRIAFSLEADAAAEPYRQSLYVVDGAGIWLERDGSRSARIATGGPNNDRLVGSTGADTLVGNRGDDTLYGGQGRDSLAGGAGRDAASYLYASNRVVVDLATPTRGGEAVGDKFSSIEDVIGSRFADRLIGSAIGNHLFGAAGNDVIMGRGGNDTLAGGAGSDTLDGGPGYDLASYETAGSAVTASLSSKARRGEAKGDIYLGIEALEGSDFNDVLTGDSGANRLLGGRGADTLIGGLVMIRLLAIMLFGRNVIEM